MDRRKVVAKRGVLVKQDLVLLYTSNTLTDNVENNISTEHEYKKESILTSRDYIWHTTLVGLRHRAD